MHRLRLRTKIEAVVAILFLMVLAAVTVASVTRTISDSGDDSYTLIRNSKGNYWEATEINLQSAIDDLTTGGTIWLPICTINVVNIIYLDDKINLIGVGYESTLRLPDNTNKDILRINGKKNILIENVHFDVNGGGQTTYGHNAIDIYGTSKNVTIRGCYFNEGVASIIDVQEDASYITVDSCYFNGRNHEGYGGAIWFSGDYCIAKNNMILDTYACGIVLESGTGLSPPKNCIIDGNIITGEISHGIHMEGSNKANNCTITNNHIFDLNSTAYLAADNHYSIGIFLQNNSICSNNRIENVHYYGIMSFGDTIISDNIIKNVAAKSGIRSNSGHAVIKGNIIEHVGLYAVKGGYIVSDNYIYDAVTGIDDAHIMTVNFIEECTTGIIVNQNGAIIGDNRILDCSYAAIDAGGNNDITITGNIIENCGTSHAIRLSTAENCVVTGNRIFDCGYSIREENGADYNIIVTNNCRGNVHSIETIGENTVKEHNIDS